MKINEISPAKIGGRPDPKLVADQLRSKCAPFLKQIDMSKLGTRMLWRSTRLLPNEFINVHQVRQDRKPRDSHLVAHRVLMYLISHCGKTANRHNSVFCYPDPYQTLDFGSHTWAVLPVGDFSYTWHQEIQDPTYELGSGKLVDVENIKWTKYVRWNAETLQYLNIDPNDTASLNRSMMDHLESNDISSLEHRLDQSALADYCQGLRGDDGSLMEALDSGNEIMIHVPEVYLVEMNYWRNHITPELQRNMS